MVLIARDGESEVGVLSKGWGGKPRLGAPTMLRIADRAPMHMLVRFRPPPGTASGKYTYSRPVSNLLLADYITLCDPGQSMLP